MEFFSILFPRGSIDSSTEAVGEPDFFIDLNLNPIFSYLETSRPQYAFSSIFRVPLQQDDDILYRQTIFQDIEETNVYQSIARFSSSMMTVRDYFAMRDKLFYSSQKQRWFLDGVHLYCKGLKTLETDLDQVHLNSSGMRAVKQYLSSYLSSETFMALQAISTHLLEELTNVTYAISIKGSRITVQHLQEELDYGALIEGIFSKFAKSTGSPASSITPDWPEMNHVEVQVLELVTKLYPELFMQMADFYEQNQQFWDATLLRFEHEVQFYMSYLEYIKGLKMMGLSFCYPQISVAKVLECEEGFDLALAHQLQLDKIKVVTNDFTLHPDERILIVTGPNQGGKTTFARSIGQILYLASLGMPVSGKYAILPLVDKWFTHFPRAEDMSDNEGKLKDELVRMRNILSRATPQSLIIMNESFSSTTLQDALWINRQVLQRISQINVLCVCVTFIDELTTLGPNVVSMAGVVDTNAPLVRTFQIQRGPASGRSYAVTIARNYRLTYEDLKERIRE